MRLIDRLASVVENAQWLDKPASVVASTLPKLGFDSRVARDALSGTQLGHPVHPLLVTVPIGSWVSASVLDALPGNERAARQLVGLGIISAIPTMAAGLSDWSSTQGPEQRVGFLHAAANTISLGIYGTSYLARRRGNHGLGAVLALVGSTTMGAGGWLGGHLSYALGVGVDTTAFQGATDDWIALGPEKDFRNKDFVECNVEGISVLVSQVDGDLHAIANRCTHRGGPLSEGKREDDCVRCPWHGSLFSLADGEVKEGPATRPQPAYDVRVMDGTVQIRRHAMSSLQKNPVGV